MLEVLLFNFSIKHTSNFYWLLKCAVNSFDSPDCGQFIAKIVSKITLNMKELKKVYFIILNLLETNPVDMLPIPLDIFNYVHAKSVPHQWLFWVFLQYCMSPLTKREWLNFLKRFGNILVKNSLEFTLLPVQPEVFGFFVESLIKDSTIFLLNLMLVSLGNIQVNFKWTNSIVNQFLHTLFANCSEPAEFLITLRAKGDSNSACEKFISEVCIDVVKAQQRKLAHQQRAIEERLEPLLVSYESDQIYKVHEFARSRRFFGCFDPEHCGSQLSLVKSVLKKAGDSGREQSFAAVVLQQEPCAVVFTRVDEMSTSGSACVDFRDREGTVVAYLDTCGAFSYGFDTPPMFDPLQKGDSLTIQFKDGMVFFKPSTINEVFQIVRPLYATFGLTIESKGHAWKVRGLNNVEMLVESDGFLKALNDVFG
ncbi:hypothetical protein GEMRC1_005023 [Eukaryota sp. GEM-RC1]